MKIFRKFKNKIKYKIDRQAKKMKFLNDFTEFKNTITTERFLMREQDFYRCFYDATPSGLSGFDMHYVYHTAWAARKIARIMPESHVDISSYLYFVNIISAFVPTTFYDFRPTDLNLYGLTSKHADITDLPIENESVHSLSCMHVVEHIGMGRYGDKIDYNGDLKAISEIKRVMTKGGHLLFVVPIGKEAKIQFNAHRIYTKDLILGYFNDYELLEFAFIRQNGEGGILRGTAEEIHQESYGCGCFWLKKRG